MSLIHILKDISYKTVSPHKIICDQVRSGEGQVPKKCGFNYHPGLKHWFLGFNCHPHLSKTLGKLV